MGDKVRVLIVDDSAFFRKRIRQELERTGEITIAGEAENGREAVELSAKLCPDLITMDVAMPLMDGISAVRAIMRDRPTNILMVSALTSEGARSTLEALDPGAVDFLAKQGGFDGAGAGGHHLGDRVISIVRRRRAQQHIVHDAVVQRDDARRTTLPRQRCGSPARLVVIGASTGGPVAVQRLLTALPAEYRYPVLVAVHMPGEFTPTFAERLDSLCRVSVRHASDGDPLLPGTVLIAPGGMQTRVEASGGRLRVRVEPGGNQLYRPSVDLLFESAAHALDQAVQAVVLTGMGSDGALGARTLKARGSSVWTQDQASSVVFGMPYAVAKAGYSDRVIALDDMGAALAGLA